MAGDGVERVAGDLVCSYWAAHYVAAFAKVGIMSDTPPDGARSPQMRCVDGDQRDRSVRSIADLQHIVPQLTADRASRRRNGRSMRIEQLGITFTRYLTFCQVRDQLATETFI